MGGIQLTRGMVAIVDSDLLEWLNQWKWFSQKGKYTYYAACNHSIESGQRRVYMHRAIMEYTGCDIFNQKVDHKDGNGLNNHHDNLRIVTNQQNMQNMKNHVKGSCQYKGVYQPKGTNRYEAGIKVNGRTIYLGSFSDPIAAAVAYDAAATIYFGEFAALNSPPA